MELRCTTLTPKPSRPAPQNSDMFIHTDGRSNAVHRRCHWLGTRHVDSRDGSWPLGSKIRRKTRRALLRRDPTVHAHTYEVPHYVPAVRTCSRPIHACGARTARWDGRPGSTGGPGGRGLTSPVTKHAQLVSSLRSAMHRYALPCEVGWEESESAHRKPMPAGPIC